MSSPRGLPSVRACRARQLVDCPLFSFKIKIHRSNHGIFAVSPKKNQHRERRQSQAKLFERVDFFSAIPRPSVEGTDWLYKLESWEGKRCTEPRPRRECVDLFPPTFLRALCTSLLFLQVFPSQIEMTFCFVLFLSFLMNALIIF